MGNAIDGRFVRGQLLQTDPIKQMDNWAQIIFSAKDGSVYGVGRR